MNRLILSLLIIGTHILVWKMILNYRLLKWKEGYLCGHDYYAIYFGIIQALTGKLGTNNVVIHSGGTCIYPKK